MMRKQHDKTGFLRHSPLVALLALMLAGLLVLSSCTGAVNPSTTDTTGTPDATETQPAATEPAASIDKPNPECAEHTGDFICKTCGQRTVADGFFAGLTPDAPLTLVGENIEVAGMVISYMELQVTVSTDGGLIGQGYSDVVQNGVTIHAACVLKNGNLYGDGAWAPEDTDGADSAEAGVTNSGFYMPLFDMLPEGVGDQIVAALAKLQSEVLPAVKEALAKDSAFDDVCARIAESMFTRKKTENGYEIALSIEKLSALNDRFNTMTVSELIDALFGEGTFAQAEQLSAGLLDMTVNDLLAQAKEAGIDVEALLAKIKEELPDDENVQSVFNQIEAMLKDETVTAKPLWQLLPSTSGEGNMTEAEYGELKQQITTVVAAVKDMTVWEAIEDLFQMLPGQGPDDSDEPDMMVDRDDTEEEPVAGLYETVKEYLAKFGSCVSLTVKLDQTGKFAGMDVSVDIPDTAKGKVQIVLGHQSEKDYESAVSKVQEKLDLLKSDKVEDMVRAYFAAYEHIELTAVSYDAQTGALQIEYTTRASTYVHSERGDKDFYVQWTQDVTQQVNLNDLTQLNFRETENGVELDVKVNKSSVSVTNVRNVAAYWVGFADLTEEEMEAYDVKSIAEDSAIDEVDGMTIGFLLVSASGEDQGTEQ